MSSANKFLRWIGVLALSFFTLFVLLPVLTIFTFSLFAGAMSSTKVIPGAKLVSVVELEGMILDSREILSELYKQARDPAVKGIVLRINSPGGAIGPAQEIFEAVKKIRSQKPVVASMGAVAASGGLYAALGADKIFCQPGTLTGSIGVILQIPNVRKISDLIGFEMTTVKSAELKDAGNAFREMTETERNYLQSTVDAAHQQFVKAVAESRELDIVTAQAISNGRIILGEEAVKIGLADEFGDLDSAARAVFDILKEPLAQNEAPILVFPMDKTRWLKKFINASTYIFQIFQGQVQFNYL